MKTSRHFDYISPIFSYNEKSPTKFVEESKTHSQCPITFLFRKSCCLWDNVEKYWRAGKCTDDNMAHAHYMLDT